MCTETGAPVSQVGLYSIIGLTIFVYGHKLVIVRWVNKPGA